MARILIILALVFQPAILALALTRSLPCGGAELAAVESCHEIELVTRCCCEGAAGGMSGESQRCPCLQRRDVPAQPEIPPQTQPTVVPLPHLMACQFAPSLSTAEGLMRGCAKQFSFSRGGRSAAEIRALHCIWLT